MEEKKLKDSSTIFSPPLLNMQMVTSGLIPQLDTGRFFAHPLQQGDHVLNGVGLKGCTRAFGGCQCASTGEAKGYEGHGDSWSSIMRLCLRLLLLLLSSSRR